MKIKQQSDKWQVANDEQTRLTRGLAMLSRHLSPAARHPKKGMALIITLIMLSVTLVMAVAFLALSKRERNAVSTTTDTTASRLAEESALAAAQARIMANVLASTNTGAYSYHLLVSTNFVDDGANLNTYNSYFDSYGNLLPGPTLERSVAQQSAMPRAPVFVITNQQTGASEFRFYLDLNRNGRFEDTGANVPQVDYSGFTNGFGQEIGDPQWIGVKEHPDQPPGPDNNFVSRYAFLAQPIGNSLDLNYIHNQAVTRTVNLPSGSLPPGVGDGYFRNEGVGSWELNLAAFLVDLNTNLWGPVALPDNNYYAYNEPYNYNNNVGRAFDDARALLSWRYAYDYNTLAVPPGYFQSALYNEGIDGYDVGNLMLDTPLTTPVIPTTKNWVGSSNTNLFYSLTSELFDPYKSSINFTNRLVSAGKLNSTYDRYTFYRLLDQLGTGSTPDEGKMNLNYDNLDPGSNGVLNANGTRSVTNFVPWTALGFFTNAADRMLRYSTAKWFEANPTNYLATYFGVTNFPNRIYPNGYGYTNAFLGVTNAVPSFGITNIPVYVNGRFFYSPAVNRLLQLAANMYDASTNSYFPSVFKPIFYKFNNGDVFIAGYNEVLSVSGTGDAQLSAPYVNTSFLPDGYSVNNLYGVPWIIGAKKGFPNFNEFYSRNIFQVTRKLQVTRTDSTKHGATGTNQLFVMSITNQMGCSFWNSYNTNFVGNNLSVHVRDQVFMVLTNGANIWTGTTNYVFDTTGFTSWPGSAWNRNPSLSPELRKPLASSFIPFAWNYAFLPESAYQSASATFVPLSANPIWDNTIPTPVFPQFGLMTTNRLQAYILDDGHVIDYVQFSGPNGTRKLSNEIADWIPKDNDRILNGTSMWDTNGYGGALAPTRGVVNQITVSMTGPKKFNNPGTNPDWWKKPPNMPNLYLGNTSLEEAEAAYFSGFFYGNYIVNGKVYQNTNLVVQAPYTPTRTAWDLTLWEANDPLVHYLASDLGTVTPETGLQRSDDLLHQPMQPISLNSENTRYQPWGKNAQMSQLNGLVGNVDTSAYNLRYRDPLVWGSDNWDFPTNKYPTVGWLGRVHRGTPWQTVYLKQRNVLDEKGKTDDVGTNTWVQWTGDTQTVNGNYYDALHSAPVNDSDLFSLFTAQPSDSASRGTLSVNQTHLAAWSALFSGVVALTNTTVVPAAATTPTYTNMIIQPAGLLGTSTNSPLGDIVASINNTRQNFVNPDGVRGTFEHVGDILRVPAYSEQSPFLNTDTANKSFGISDELYEWLPQQTLGLLRVSSAPRYVVYCFGQTLRPAPNGTVLSGNYFNMVTNYQVTAESAARAVIRVDRHVTPTGTNYSTVVESYNQLPPD